MNITLLNVNHTTKTAKNGKPYQVAEVAYKNNTYGGAIEGFKVTSYMKAYADVAAAAIGDTLEVAVEKKNGFNEWLSATKSIPGMPVQQPTSVGGMPKAPGAAVAKPPVGAAFGRDFETREERAKKQVYIVRQSAISSAIAALSVGGKSALKAEDVLVYAKKLESFVFENGTGFDDVPTLDPSFHVEQEPEV